MEEALGAGEGYEDEEYTSGVAGPLPGAVTGGGRGPMPTPVGLPPMRTCGARSQAAWAGQEGSAATFSFALAPYRTSTEGKLPALQISRGIIPPSASGLREGKSPALR